MWSRTNSQGFPSKGEISKVNKEILKLKSELKRAREVVRQLETGIREREEYISPVRKLPFDILAYIFIICAKQDPLSPLSISAVSHWWRNIILATPVAWSFPDPIVNFTPQRLSMFFERSVPYLHHVGVFTSYTLQDRTSVLVLEQIDVIKKNTHRLKCIKYHEEVPDLLCLAFPNLTRLDALRFKVPLHHLSRSNYPALQFLQVSSLIYDPPGPPVDLLTNGLLELRLIVQRNNTWVELVQANASSILSMYLPGPSSTSQVFPEDICSVYMPSLIDLTINTTLTSSEALSNRGPWHWPVQLVTPNLKQYNHRSTEGEIIQLDIDQVTQLRCNYIPSLVQYPSLRILQLSEMNLEAVEGMINNIIDSPVVASLLEFIEYMDVYFYRVLKTDTIEEKLKDRQRNTGLETKFDITSDPFQMINPTEDLKVSGPVQNIDPVNPLCSAGAQSI